MTSPTLTSSSAPTAVAQPPSAVRAGPAARTAYVLRLADTLLVWSHRLSEWCGHAPVLEEDIALANVALDLLGQSRALLTHAAALEGAGRDEDQLAFLREERDFLNVTLAELPNAGPGGDGGRDFAFTVLRNFVLAAWALPLWQRLAASSSDAQLAAIAAKAMKETRYHREHSADWVERLGDGTAESAQRMRTALDRLWPYTAELFDSDEVDRAAAAAGIGPAWGELRHEWEADVREVLAAAQLGLPSEGAFRSEGKRGRHSEHMGRLLAEMQYLQRAYPGGTW